MDLDVNNFNILLMKGESGYKLLRTFNGNSKLKEWKPIELEFYEDKSIYQSDVYSFNGIPVFEDNSKLQNIKSILLQYGELLPVNCERKTLYLYNVTTVIDALDVEKSKCMIIGEQKIILKVERPVFKTELLEGVDIFKVVQANLFTIYVSANFVKLVNENNIIGFLFKDFS